MKLRSIHVRRYNLAVKGNGRVADGRRRRTARKLQFPTV